MAMHKNDEITLDHVKKLVKQEHDCNSVKLDKLDEINYKKICGKFAFLFAKVNTIFQEINNLKKSNIKITSSINTLAQKQNHLQVVHATLAKNTDQLENEYIRKYELLIEKLKCLNHV